MAEAMKRPQSPDNVPAIQSNNLTIRETGLEYIQCLVIIGILEYWRHNVFVADVKIRI